jgi:deoxyribodipyrimidine photo-lyase
VSRPADLVAWARQEGLGQVVTPWAPVGPVRDRLEAARAAGLPLRMVLRASDAAAWPHATKGFFKFKERIPKLVERLQQRDLFAG